MEKDITMVNVGGTRVGLVGLKEVFEEIKKEEGKSDEDLKWMLLERVKVKNYVPSSAQEKYGIALLREYKKFIGEKVEEERGALEIKVLGLGCYNCQRLESQTRSALAELGLSADLEHVYEPNRIADYGIFGTPGLVIDGKVRSAGRVPSKEEIKKWLKEAVQKRKEEEIVNPR